ncbi:MAG: hypothetical protein LBI62_05270 [Candidatus Accumulibacter sp.]|nr:hypothetical protein [Accumulibacter sp.]
MELNYLTRVFFGLPTRDSEELIAAKSYRPSPSESLPDSLYDLYSKELDPFMSGQVAPVSGADDQLNSEELEKRVEPIYRRASSC